MVDNSLYKEDFHLENPYTKNFFSQKALDNKATKKLLDYLKKSFGMEELTLALTIAVWGMLYSVFTEYRHFEKSILSIKNGRSSTLYEILMTQWVKRKIFPICNTKNYEKIIYDTKDSILFFQMNQENKYAETVILNKLLPILQKNEIYNEKTGDVIKLKALYIIETSNYKVLNKTFTLPFDVDKNLNVELNPEEISALYNNICKWLEKNYSWVTDEIKTSIYKNNVPSFMEMHFCLMVSYKILSKYCSLNIVDAPILNEHEFDIFLIEWLSEKIEISGKADGDKILDRILEMKKEGLIHFISRQKYNGSSNVKIEFALDDKWVFISPEVICQIAEKLFGNITKYEIKKTLLEAGITEMEKDRFGTTVFVGKEKKKMTMVRIERHMILNDAEMMRYMEV